MLQSKVYTNKVFNSDKIFNKYIVYTDTQSTGLQSIQVTNSKPFEFNHVNTDTTSTQYISNVWRLSNFRATNTSPELFKANDTNEYIDKILIPQSGALSKFSLQRLRSNYFNTRLFFTPSLNEYIHNFSVTTNTINTFR